MKNGVYECQKCGWRYLRLSGGWCATFWRNKRHGWDALWWRASLTDEQFLYEYADCKRWLIREKK